MPRLQACGNIKDLAGIRGSLRMHLDGFFRRLWKWLGRKKDRSVVPLLDHLLVFRMQKFGEFNVHRDAGFRDGSFAEVFIDFINNSAA